MGNINQAQILSQNKFEKYYLNKQLPVIISSGLTWPALNWTPQYFKEFMRDKIVDLTINQVGKRQDRYQDFHQTRPFTMREAVDLICNNENPNIKHYLMQKPIYKDFPELSQDFAKPIWQSDEKKYEVNLWFGEAGNATPLHYDPTHNFLVQIYGRKYIRLFSPSDTKYLYQHNRETDGAFHLSQIKDIDKIDVQYHPKFKYATAFEAILSPGNTLYIPPGWWHDVRSLDPAISLSFWWKPKLHECPLPHILAYNAYNIFEKNMFADIKRHILDLEDFNNDLHIAKYLIDNGYYWVSVLFMAHFYKEQQIATATILGVPNLDSSWVDAMMDYHHSLFLLTQDILIKKSVLKQLIDLVKTAKLERDELFKKENLIDMYEKINSYSIHLKSKLLEGCNIPETF